MNERESLEETLAKVLDLRKLIRDGHDGQGNRASHLAPQILADAERDLGRLYADWCER